MEPHQAAITLAKSGTHNLNEADTRARIIDEVVHVVLSWPKAAVRRECFVDPGYMDYAFVRTDGQFVLVLEAKKEGTYFELPESLIKKGEATYIQVKTLMTDDEIKKAIQQVHQYCVSVGCQYAGITNGNQWIFFRTFEPGQEWRNLRAFVISGLDYFSARFTEASNTLGYTAIKDKGSLRKVLAGEPSVNRPIFFPKERISAFTQNLRGNYLAAYLRPLMDLYFGVLDESDPEFMDFCYIQTQKQAAGVRDAYAVLHDSLTPYLEQYRIQDTDTTETGGRFVNRVSRSVLHKRASDVVVLFGGKGIGKSTFLRRLFYHRPPQILKKNAAVALIDLLKVAPVRDRIDEAIWGTVVEGLDKDAILGSERPALLQLFGEQYETAKKQVLFGLDEGSEAFNLRLNELVQKWLVDRKLCARCLAEYWRNRHKGVVVVLDNTDQFDRDLQEFCFATAHEISKELDCLVIIAMREERFYASTVRGMLDAYHNSGFHLTAPSAKEVFLRRIEFAQKILSRPETRAEVFGEDTSAEYQDRIATLFKVFENEFRFNEGHLTDFLSACAHGNIRLALELFRNFVSSRYTNVYEMTEVGPRWTLLIHQVLKPIMMPDRVFYDEALSRVPNLFRSRSRQHASHFTAYRILKQLAEGSDPSNPKYISMPTLQDYFGDIFYMQDDLILNVDMLLRYGLVEAGNRIDQYTPDVDSLRITTYGTYLYKDLSKFFTYLDLVSTDTPIHDEGVANSLAALANEEFRLWELSLSNPELRVNRVEKRLEKVETFLQYLIAEEQKEIEQYRIASETSIMQPIGASFAKEKDDVLRSAKKQKYQKR
jgi:hypothetical protein